MKRILLTLIVFFFMCGMAWAASNVTFGWDANSEADLAGYRLYQTQIIGQYTFGDGNEVASVAAGIEELTIIGVGDGVYYWVLIAYDTHGNESGPSNEVTADLDTLGPGVPSTVVITIIIKVQ